VRERDVYSFGSLSSPEKGNRPNFRNVIFSNYNETFVYLSWMIVQYLWSPNKSYFQNFWGSRICPAPGNLNTKRHIVSETGSVSVLRWWEEDAYSVGSLKRSQLQTLDKPCHISKAEHLTSGQNPSNSERYKPSSESFRFQILFSINPAFIVFPYLLFFFRTPDNESKFQCIQNSGCWTKSTKPVILN
jgi:hypothetical protein